MSKRGIIVVAAGVWSAVLVLSCAEPVRPLPEPGDPQDSNMASDTTAALPDALLDMSNTSPPPLTCTNGLQDGDETATDCGGTCPRGCALGEPCRVSADCASERCVGGRCQGIGCQIDADCPIDLPWCTAGSCVACTTTAHCDDGNPCTDDRCELNQCFNSPRSGPCDDGFYCNGTEHCVAGQCVNASAAPCGAGLPCHEARRSCDACSTDSDCGAPVEEPWTRCEPLAQPCELRGQRSRVVRMPRCVGGACMQETIVQTEACDRATDGQTCGDLQFGPWDRDCATSCGTVNRSRTVITPTCSGGLCQNASTTETQTCNGLPEGAICGEPVTYCGSVADCRVCRGNQCTINTPHWDASCRPSCGAASGMCGVAGICCPASAACSRGELGPAWDCDRCCADGCE